MADAKISALPASTTPLAGTEVLPIVQSGATKQVSIANVTAGRAVSATSVALNGATSALTPAFIRNGSFSCSSFGADKQLATFGAYNNDLTNGGFVLSALVTDVVTEVARGGTAGLTVTSGNLVIGTAGKGIDFSADGQAAGMTSELLDDYEEGTWTPSVGGDATYTAQSGKYIKVGSAVSINGRVKINVLGTGSAFLITGLPFTSSNDGIGSSVHIAVWANLATIPVYASGYVYPNFAGIELHGTLTGTATLSALGILGDSAEIYFSGNYFV